MHTKTRRVMKNLVLAGLAAVAVSALSGCCGMKCCKGKSCPCMEKGMSRSMKTAPDAAAK